MATPTTQDVSPDGSPEQRQALYQGTRAIKTLQLAPAASYSSNNQWTPVGGLTYETIKPGGTPAGGAVIPVTVGTSDTAEQIASALAVAINAQSTSTVTASTNGTGIVTLIEKNIGSAGKANVAVQGTAAATYVLVQAGTDAITDGGPIKIRQSVAVADAATITVPDLETEVMGGFEIDFNLVVKTAASSQVLFAMDGSSWFPHWNAINPSNGASTGSASNSYLAGQLAFAAVGDRIIGTIKCEMAHAGTRRLIKADNSVHVTGIAGAIVEIFNSKIVTTTTTTQIRTITFAITNGTFDGALSTWQVRRF